MRVFAPSRGLEYHFCRASLKTGNIHLKIKNRMQPEKKDERQQVPCVILRDEDIKKISPGTIADIFLLTRKAIRHSIFT
jgi:hypothetical protein